MYSRLFQSERAPGGTAAKRPKAPTDCVLALWARCGMDPSARAMDPDVDGLAAELELLQAMYTVEEDELCITGGAPGSTEVAMRLRPQTGGERAQRFMEVVLQLRCGDGYPSKSAPTIRLQRARGFVEDEEAQLLRGVHARAAELQGKYHPYLRLCPCPCPAPPPLSEHNLPLRPTPFAPTLAFAPAPTRIPTLPRRAVSLLAGRGCARAAHRAQLRWRVPHLPRATL